MSEFSSEWKFPFEWKIPFASLPQWKSIVKVKTGCKGDDKMPEGVLLWKERVVNVNALSIFNLLRNKGKTLKI